jgi:uncharacterized membrane protein YhaH (DUF805 family)
MIMEWMTMPLKRYAEFSGRSRRKEYWMYVLLIFLVAVVLGVIESVLGLAQTVGPYGPLSALLALATLIPSIAVGIRRLHDTDRSGWWMLIGILPYIVALGALFTGNLGLAGVLTIVALIGGVVLLVFLVLDGTKGPNRYGPDPKGSAPEEVFS